MNPIKNITVSKSSFIYIFITLAITVEIILTIVFVPKKIQTIISTNETISKLKETNQSTRKSLTISEQMDNTVLDNAFRVSKAALPSEKKTSGLFTGLFSIASSSGVLVGSLEFSPGKISSQSAAQAGEIVLPEGVRFVPASLNVTAEFNQLVNFLSKLENASQIVGINSISFNRQNQGAPITNLGLEVFFQPETITNQNQLVSQPITSDEEKIINGISSEDIYKQK